MKRILLIALVACLSVSSSFAQLPNGSTGPDFTVTDINGNTISLYTDFLDQGKPVIMDISATWCGPCWGFHQTHAMKDIYMNYGDGGSEEIGVLFVEGDASTGLGELQGISGSTLGDWVTGTPYPILDNASIANSYQIAYYPTVYGICPDRTVYEIGTGNANNLMQQLITNCSSVTGFNGVVDNIAVAEGSTKICSGQNVTPSATVHNYGTNNITSFTAELFEVGNPTAIDINNWTGALAINNDITVQFNPLTVTNSTDYEVFVSNPNGNVDNYPTMNDADYAIQIAPITTENIVVFSITTDGYPEETSWIIKDGAGTTLASGGTYTGQPNTTFTANITLANNDCYEITVNDTYGDGLLSGGYSLTDSNGIPLILAVAPAFGYSVIEPFSKSTMTSSGIEQLNIEEINIYPNPVNDIATLSFTTTEKSKTAITIFNILGEIVYSNEIGSLASGQHIMPISTSGISEGMYFVNLITNNKIITKKITIVR